MAAENSIESKDALLRECYNMLEKDLRILGGTGVEDRLQPMVPSTLTNMRAAGLAIWLLTGDSRQTAESVATRELCFCRHTEKVRAWVRLDQETTAAMMMTNTREEEGRRRVDTL